MYPENPERTQEILGSMNVEYISDTARNRTHNLFRPKREPIPLGHSDGMEHSAPRFLQSLVAAHPCGGWALLSRNCELTDHGGAYSFAILFHVSALERNRGCTCRR